MRHRLRIGQGRGITLLVVLLIVQSACAPAVQPTQSPVADPGPTDAATESPGAAPIRGEPSATPDATPQPQDEGEPTPAPPETEPPAALPDDPWRTAELRDVRSGETFTINELAGRLVVVEPMAIWCVNCRAQQNEARDALASLRRDDIVYVSLDVDPNETEPDLARYADQHDWPWRFVVASREVARSLADTFGEQVLSPPSTPKIVISPAGQAEVSFGHKPADQLEAELAALLP